METMTSTVPRGRITVSRAKTKNQNKHNETKYASIFNRLFGVKSRSFQFFIGLPKKENDSIAGYSLF